MINESIQFKSLGTDINIQIIGEEKDRDTLRNNLLKMENFYQDYQKIFSRFDDSSELSRLNSNLGVYQKVSSPILELTQHALDFHSLTQGYFDPRIINILENIGYRSDFKTTDFNEIEIKENTVKLDRALIEDIQIDGDRIKLGNRIDLSGLAKGYITDKAVEYLQTIGCRNILVDSGGDIRAVGCDEEGSSWRISLEGFPEDKLVLELTDKYQGIATSGVSRRKWEKDGNRYHHIINPKNPQEFRFDLRSVTVIGHTAEEADLWAKVLFLMGLDEGIEFSNKNNLKSIFLDSKGNIKLSSAIKENLMI